MPQSGVFFVRYNRTPSAIAFNISSTVQAATTQDRHQSNLRDLLEDFAAPRILKHTSLKRPIPDSGFDSPSLFHNVPAKPQPLEAYSQHRREVP